MGAWHTKDGDRVGVFTITLSNRMPRINLVKNCFSKIPAFHRKGTTQRPGRENRQNLSLCGRTGAHFVPTLIAKTPEIGAFWAEPENNSLTSRLSGGEGGIRTPGTLSGTAVFKTACFNRSHTSPRESCQQFISTRESPLRA